MERWRPLNSGEIRAANQLIRVKLIYSQPSRRFFREATANELIMELNIARDQAEFLIDGYTKLFYPSETSIAPVVHRKSLWFDAISPEISLEKEHLRQAKIMAQLFSKRLSMSEEEYIDALPPFPDKPLKFIGSGLRPVIVEGNRFPWIEQAILSGIDVTIPESESVLITGGQHSFRGLELPEKPFTTWISIVDREFGGDIFHMIWRKFTPTEQCGNILEGIAYWNAYPNIARRGLFNLIESSEGNTMPFLDCQSSQPRIATYDCQDFQGPLCHTLTRTDMRI